MPPAVVERAAHEVERPGPPQSPPAPQSRARRPASVAEEAGTIYAPGSLRTIDAVVDFRFRHCGHRICLSQDVHRSGSGPAFRTQRSWHRNLKVQPTPLSAFEGDWTRHRHCVVECGDSKQFVQVQACHKCREVDPFGHSKNFVVR